MKFLDALFSGRKLAPKKSPVSPKTSKQTPKSSRRKKPVQGTRPDGTKWWQVVQRFEKGLVVEEDPFGGRRWRWKTKKGVVKIARSRPKNLD